MGYGAMGFVTYRDITILLAIPAEFWYDGSEKEKNMTTEMIHEIMQEMFYNNHSGGLDYIESEKVNKIIQSYFPKAFESFKPNF